MICLGIEGTAHTFAIGVIDENGKILADERAIYKPKKGKGIVPHEAARHHEKNCEKIVKKILSRIDLKKIDVIAYSCGPGLPPPLLVTANFAFKLAEKWNKILIQVNHCVGHLEIGKLMTKTKDPVFVYLSGGNTQVIALKEGRYRVLGETLDISIGNCLDVVARELGYEMPGGPKIDELAERGKNYIKLPYVVKGMDLSFSGILTKCLELIKKGYKKEDIAYSLEETCFAMLTEVTERALAHTNKKEVLLVGGVAASPKLQKMMRIMCKERGAKVYVVPREYAGDNGVMIALVGILAYKSKWKPNFKDKIKPKWRIDEVEITWI